MSKMSKKIKTAPFHERVQVEALRVPIMSFEQAIADGMYGYEIRAIAAALERKAKNKGGEQVSFIGPKENFDNAYHLRKLAKRVDEHWKNNPDKAGNSTAIRLDLVMALEMINEDRGIYTVGGHLDDFFDRLYETFDDEILDGNVSYDG